MFGVIFFTLFSVSFGSSLKLDSFSTSPSIVQPGDLVDLTVRVQNVFSSNDDLAKYNYNIFVEPSDDLAENNVVILDGFNNLGRLDSNEFWNSKFEFKIEEGAPSGDYKFDIIMNKLIDDLIVSSSTVIISIGVIGETFFELDSEDKTIGQGETKTFNSVIRNVGGSRAGSIKVTFGNTDDISIVGSNSFYFDNIENNDEANFNITFNAKNNLESGSYNFPVVIEYNDGTKIVTQKLDAGIIVGGNVDLMVASIETIPKEVRPGDNYVLVSVNLENAGEDDAKSISAVLESDNFISSYSNNNLVYAGRVDSGSYTNLKFYINVPKSLASEVYYFDLNLDYNNLMGDNFAEVLKVPFYVKEKPVLEIKNVVATGDSGTTISVIIDVENTGEENAEEVDIRLVSDSSLPFIIEERSVYIGAINSDEIKRAIFKVKISSDAEINEYNLRAFLRARGDSEIGDNNIYTYNKNVNISVVGKSLNILAIFGFIIAVIVLFVIFFRKKNFLKIKKK